MYETEHIKSELNYLKDSLLFKLKYDVENSKASPESKKLAEEYINFIPKSFDQIETLTSHILDILLKK